MTHTLEQIAAHGGHWRAVLIDADFYDTRRAAALINSRLAKGGVFIMRAVVGVLLLAVVLLLLWSMA